MQKVSRFNYYTENAEGDLLLYNTMKGAESLLKIREPYRQTVQELLDHRLEPEELPEPLRERLAAGGFLVPAEEDEGQKLKSLYLDCIDAPELELTILPTEQCNFRCRYCYESFPDTYMGAEVQEAILTFLSRHISRYKGLHISWFGGEPLLALDTILSLSERMMAICRRHQKPYTASMTTNAYLLDMETFRKLAKVKVLYYQITVDGLKNTHDRQRPLRDGGPSFERILSHLEAIRDQAKSSSFRITLRTNFSREMVADIPEYKRFFGERFGRDPRFQFFFRPVMDWGGDRIEEFRDSILEERLMAEIYQAAMDGGPEMHFIYDDFLNPGGSVCYAAKRNAYTITPAGDVFKCTCDFANEPRAKVGGTTKEKGIVLDSYRCAQWLCQPDHCERETCFFSPNCLRECCPAQRVLQRKSKTKCPLEKRNLPMTLRLLDSQNQLFQEV